MFLATSEIARLVLEENQLLDRGTYDPGSLKQASYDLRLGAEYYIPGKHAPDKLSERSPYLSLAPGQFALLTCFEDLNMTEHHMAFITLRLTFKLQGLVNISGFHVDPTHRGKLLFAVQNVGPTDIRLKYQAPTFTIFFAQLHGNIENSREKESTNFKAKLDGIRLQDVQVLGGSSVTILKLKKDLDQLRFIVLVYTPLVVAVVAALVKLFWPTGSK